jgi:hypothetical protein
MLCSAYPLRVAPGTIFVDHLQGHQHVNVRAQRGADEISPGKPSQAPPNQVPDTRRTDMAGASFQFLRIGVSYEGAEQY